MIYEVFVDGAARGQGVEGKTGHGAAAVMLYKNKKLIGQYARGLGKVTNNHAEYEAVLMGLIMCWSADLRDPVIYSDSTLVVNQVTGKWRCENEDLLPLLLSIQEIQEVFRFRIVHVKRSYVAEADALCNELLDTFLEPKVTPKKKRRQPKDSTEDPENGK